MYIEVESRAKALDQCYCTSRRVHESASSFVDQMCRNYAVNNAQHLAHRLRMGGEQVPQGKWKTDDPLTQWRVGKYFIREKGRGLGHAAGATAGAEPALLARKCYELLELPRIATHTKKPVFEATAFENTGALRARRVS